MFLLGQTVREEEAREGEPEAGLTRSDSAEGCIGFYEQAGLRTRGEKRSNMSDRLSHQASSRTGRGMRAVYPALSLSELRRRRPTVSLETP